MVERVYYMSLLCVNMEHQQQLVDEILCDDLVHRDQKVAGRIQLCVESSKKEEQNHHWRRVHAKLELLTC